MCWPIFGRIESATVNIFTPIKKHIVVNVSVVILIHWLP